MHPRRRLLSEMLNGTRKRDPDIKVAFPIGARALNRDKSTPLTILLLLTVAREMGLSDSPTVKFIVDPVNTSPGFGGVRAQLTRASSPTHANAGICTTVPRRGKI